METNGHASCYDEYLILSRPCYKYRTSTWETFKSPVLQNNDTISRLLQQNVGSFDILSQRDNLNLTELCILLERVKQNVKKLHWQEMVKFHCGERKKAKSLKDYVDKKCLVNLLVT